MRTIEPQTTPPTERSPRVGPMWWLLVVLSAAVAIAVAYVGGALATLSLNVPETDAWETPALILAGLVGGAVAGVVGQVHGWWLAAIPLIGAATTMLVFALFLLYGLDLGMGFGFVAWAACTLVIVASTRYAYGR